MKLKPKKKNENQKKKILKFLNRKIERKEENSLQYTHRPITE